MSKIYISLYKRMFCCYMCASDEWTTTGLCSVCHDIKQFVEDSSSKEVLAILKEVKRIKEETVIDECPTRELNLRSGKKKCYSSVCRGE
tara:strand:+ start:650 stop:916 length:267 start_codon:yes stop_codon:yes gene_type:complete